MAPPDSLHSFSSSTDGADGRYRLRLYVVGGAQNSLRALANLEVICRRYLPEGCELEIVDVLQQPRRALSDGVIVTPTLVKLNPSPVARIVGDLSRTAMVLMALGLAEQPHG